MNEDFSKKQAKKSFYQRFQRSSVSKKRTTCQVLTVKLIAIKRNPSNSGMLEAGFRFRATWGNHTILNQPYNLAKRRLSVNPIGESSVMVAHHAQQVLSDTPKRS
jgi:hypothetical protein